MYRYQGYYKPTLDGERSNLNNEHVHRQSSSETLSSESPVENKKKVHYRPREDVFAENEQRFLEHHFEPKEKYNNTSKLNNNSYIHEKISRRPTDLDSENLDNQNFLERTNKENLISQNNPKIYQNFRTKPKNNFENQLNLSNKHFKTNPNFISQNLTRNVSHDFLKPFRSFVDNDSKKSNRFPTYSNNFQSLFNNHQDLLCRKENGPIYKNYELLSTPSRAQNLKEFQSTTTTLQPIFKSTLKSFPITINDSKIKFYTSRNFKELKNVLIETKSTINPTFTPILNSQLEDVKTNENFNKKIIIGSNFNKVHNISEQMNKSNKTKIIENILKNKTNSFEKTIAPVIDPSLINTNRLNSAKFNTKYSNHPTIQNNSNISRQNGKDNLQSRNISLNKTDRSSYVIPQYPIELLTRQKSNESVEKFTSQSPDEYKIIYTQEPEKVIFYSITDSYPQINNSENSNKKQFQRMYIPEMNTKNLSSSRSSYIQPQNELKTTSIDMHIVKPNLFSNSSNNKFAKETPSIYLKLKKYSNNPSNEYETPNPYKKKQEYNETTRSYFKKSNEIKSFESQKKIPKYILTNKTSRENRHSIVYPKAESREIGKNRKTTSSEDYSKSDERFYTKELTNFKPDRRTSGNLEREFLNRKRK